MSLEDQRSGNEDAEEPIPGPSSRKSNRKGKSSSKVAAAAKAKKRVTIDSEAIYDEDEENPYSEEEDEYYIITRKETLTTAYELKVKQERGPHAKQFVLIFAAFQAYAYFGVIVHIYLILSDIFHYDTEYARKLTNIAFLNLALSPMIGSVIADNWLGKYRTIKIISSIGILPCATLIFGTISKITYPLAPEIFICNVMIIVVIIDLIQPAVLAITGDQFILPDEKQQMKAHFAWYYWVLMLSEFSAYFISTQFGNVSCLGRRSCYPLSFSLILLIYTFGYVIIKLGRPALRLKDSEGRVFFLAIKCIFTAIFYKIKYREHRRHWLDHASVKYGNKLVYEIKTILKILKVLFPTPFILALYFQERMNWYKLASHLNCDLIYFYLYADKIRMIPSFLLILIIPAFQFLVYPYCKMLVMRKMLRRMILGAILALITYVISGGFYLYLRSLTPRNPEQNEGFLTIANNMPCTVSITMNGTENGTYKIPSFDRKLFMWDLGGIKKNYYSAVSECYNTQDKFDLVRGKRMLYFVSDVNKPMVGVVESFSLNTRGHTIIRNFVSFDSNRIPIANTDVAFINEYGIAFRKALNDHSEISIEIPGAYTLLVGSALYREPLILHLGGVYEMFAHITTSQQAEMHIFEVTKAPEISVMWMLPQFIILAISEMMFCINGMAFIYTQTPSGFKSILLAFWYLCSRVGVMLVAVVPSIEFGEPQEIAFAFGTIVIFLTLFIVFAKRYRYVRMKDVFDVTKIVQKDSVYI